MIKAVSFDCAQTLLEVRWDAHLVAMESAKLAGLDLPASAATDYARLFGTRQEGWSRASSRHISTESSEEFWKKLTQDWLAMHGAAEHSDAVIAASHQVFFGPESEVFKPFPGAAEIVEQLKKQGLKLIVLSNWDDSLEKALYHCGMHEPFDAIYASLIEGAEKPDPAFFSLAQENLGLEPYEILHIGDNPLDDAIGALNMGWNALLIKSELAAGPWNLDEKGLGMIAKSKVNASPWLSGESWPPCPVIESYSELPAILKELNS